MRTETLHRYLYIFSAFLIFSQLGNTVSLYAQNNARSKKTDEVLTHLRKDLTAYLSQQVLPLFGELKTQYDASLKPADFNRLESLRKQTQDLLMRIHDNEKALALARRNKEFKRALDLRNRLESFFDTRKRLLAEAQRIGMRSGDALTLLQTRLDSAKEEWKAGAIRIFIDWFARHQTVIRPLLTDDRDQTFVDFMSAAKDFRLEETTENALYYFLLWDGTDFVPGIASGNLPETPLSRTGPSRERSILFDACSPATFSTTTTIRFTLPINGLTRIQVFDSQGKAVATLLNEDLPSGSHSTVFKADRLPSGTYFFHLTCRDLCDVQVARLTR